MRTNIHPSSRNEAPPRAIVAPAVRGEVISGFRGGLLQIRRTFDASNLNVVANHPDVQPWLGFNGQCDLSPHISNPFNFALETDGGGFLLIRKDAGIYEAHSLFLPEARSRTVAAMRAGLAYMFAQTDAFRIVTQVPDANPAAKGLAAKGGFREWFRNEATLLGPSSFYMLELDAWVQNEPLLEVDGEWFHEQLEAAKVVTASHRPIHPHDPAHERAVGAAVRMFKAGMPHKALATYNRWAAISGYALITLLSDAPVVIDVVDAVVTLSGTDMEVLQCR